MLFESIDWRRFARPMKGLSARSWAHLALAFLYESGDGESLPAGEPAEQTRRLSALGRAVHEDALALAALLPPCPPIERAVRMEAAQAALTAALYRMKGARAVRPALAFYLIEETDRLYRFANLMDAEQEKPAESALDGLCEITPGRPCAAQHRDPADAAFEPLDFETAPHAAIYAAIIQSGVKRAVMRLYTEWTAMAQSEARPLFAEAALLLEEQAAAYLSLWDARLTAAERALWRRRAAAYLFESLRACETDARLIALWDEMAARKACQRTYASALAGKSEADAAVLPPFFVLGDHSDTARAILQEQSSLTRLHDALIPVEQMPAGQAYFAHQSRVVGTGEELPSHRAVERYIARYGTDYRYERRASVLGALQNRRQDDLALARGNAARRAKEPLPAGRT